MLTNFHEKRKLDESYGFVESSETRKFRQEHPNLKLFCRNLDFCFLSSAAYGRGCTADKYVAAFVDGEMIAGEILFFFRGIANNCVLRKFKNCKKVDIDKISGPKCCSIRIYCPGYRRENANLFKCHQT